MGCGGSFSGWKRVVVDPETNEVGLRGSATHCGGEGWGLLTMVKK